jgi:hypothetical protein
LWHNNVRAIGHDDETTEESLSLYAVLHMPMRSSILSKQPLSEAWQRRSIGSPIRQCIPPYRLHSLCRNRGSGSVFLDIKLKKKNTAVVYVNVSSLAHRNSDLKLGYDFPSFFQESAEMLPYIDKDCLRLYYSDFTVPVAKLNSALE